MKKRYDVPTVQIYWTNEADILRTSFNFIDYEDDFGDLDEDIFV